MISPKLSHSRAVMIWISSCTHHSWRVIIVPTSLVQQVHSLSRDLISDSHGTLIVPYEEFNYLHGQFTCEALLSAIRNAPDRREWDRYFAIEEHSTAGDVLFTSTTTEDEDEIEHDTGNKNINFLLRPSCSQTQHPYRGDPSTRTVFEANAEMHRDALYQNREGSVWVAVPSDHSAFGRVHAVKDLPIRNPAAEGVVKLASVAERRRETAIKEQGTSGEDCDRGPREAPASRELTNSGCQRTKGSTPTNHVLGATTEPEEKRWNNDAADASSGKKDNLKNGKKSVEQMADFEFDFTRDRALRARSTVDELTGTGRRFFDRVGNKEWCENLFVISRENFAGQQTVGGDLYHTLAPWLDKVSKTVCRSVCGYG